MSSWRRASASSVRSEPGVDVGEHGAVHERRGELVRVVPDLRARSRRVVPARGAAGTAGACASRPRSRRRTRSPTAAARSISSAASANRPSASASVACADGQHPELGRLPQLVRDRVIEASSAARRSGSPSSQAAQNECSCPSKSRSLSPVLTTRETISPPSASRLWAVWGRDAARPPPPQARRRASSGRRSCARSGPPPHRSARDARERVRGAGPRRAGRAAGRAAALSPRPRRAARPRAAGRAARRSVRASTGTCPP